MLFPSYMLSPDLTPRRTNLMLERSMLSEKFVKISPVPFQLKCLDQIILPLKNSSKRQTYFSKLKYVA